MMATSHTPQPPSHRLHEMAARRSVTVPSKLQTQVPRQTPVEIGAADGIETLYVHPSARVVSFNTASLSASSPSRRQAEGSVPTLSWKTSTERTLAVGLLEIYRVPGSVSFLHSGALLHAILPRSQCWCVDGVSVFVFRVLPNQYYRIELPGETEEDLERVEKLKATLQKVLHYERTACPFKRGFSVDIADTPTPSPRPARARVAPLEPAKKWKLDGVWRPEDWEALQAAKREKDSAVDTSFRERSTRSARAESVMDRTRSPLVTTSVTHSASPARDASPALSTRTSSKARPWSISVPNELFEGAYRSRALTARRTEEAETTPQPGALNDFTPLVSSDEKIPSTGDSSSPAQLQARVPDISESVCTAEQESDPVFTVGEAKEEAKLISSDATAKTSKAAEPEPEPTATLLPAELPQSEDLPAAPSLKLTTDAIATQAPLFDPDTPASRMVYSEDDAVETMHGWSSISTPSLSSDSEDQAWNEVITPPSTIRIRRPRPGKTTHAFSPSPTARRKRPNSTRAASTPQSSGEQNALVPSSLVRRTVGIFLGPPANIVSVMLRIASRLSKGGALFDALTIKSPENSPRSVPGGWYLADGGAGFDKDDDWSADGYGFSGRMGELVPKGPEQEREAGAMDAECDVD